MKITPLRCYFFCLACMLSIISQAKNYYISSSTGSDSYTSTQAQNPATPWKSIAKLNSFFSSIVPGDNIYFKRGDVFFGSIVINKSGSSGNLITISTYGTGARPLISGLITLSSWSAVGNGIYQASAPSVKSSVNLLTLNGVPQAVGRYPNIDAANGGYLTYESFSGTTSITDNELTAPPNWTGAEVVIRKQHFMMEKCKITSQSGSVINFTPTESINPLNNSVLTPFSASAGYGYFIQRDVRTLDKLGEWYFNNSTKNMQIYFGSTAPSSYTIKVSTLDTLVNIGTNNYVNINNISFEGANAYAVYAANAGNITIQACDLTLMGAKGIILFNSGNVLVDNITSNNVLCNAIDLTSRSQANITVTNCNISNTALLAGMGSFWDDNDYKAISVTVTTGGTIANNNIINTGYVGIQFQGNNFSIKNNFINYYALVKDDGGGIYTFERGTDAAPGPVYTNRVIQNNIIMNGVGAPSGAGGETDVDGIYLDGRSSNMDILDNTIANVGVNGIYTVNPHYVNVRRNTCFNDGAGLGITRNSWSSTANFTVKQNIFYPKFSNQGDVDYKNTGINVPLVSTIEAAIKSIGLIDSNYWATPNARGFNYYYSLTEGSPWIFPPGISFEGWKTLSNNDRVSALTPPIPTYKLNSTIGSNMVVNSQFTTNINNVTIWSPTTNIASSWDNSGKITGTGSLKITPTKTSSYFTFLYGTVGAVSSAKQYILRFTTLGSATNGIVQAYIRKTASPQTILSSVQSTTFGNSVEVHEFLFTAPTTDAAASFLIAIQQSGTTYIDDIQFYEANATVLNIDDQLRFEYNATATAKTISLGATYVGIDKKIYNGSITLQPYTSSILVKTGPVVGGVLTPPPATIVASASFPAINCFNGTTNVIVTGSGGTAPYSGTGTYTVNAGKGSLKIAVAAPVANTSTSMYSAIGPVSSTKTYVLRFTTLGTTSGGSLTAALRQTNAPWGYITPLQTRTFGTSRADHQFIFTAPATMAAASFVIELDQSSGTTWFDNIAVFEATTAGVLTGPNLYVSGQFETSIAGITTWSLAKNHTASLDVSSKISNTYYYTVKDANGNTTTATAAVTQPAAALSVLCTSPNVTTTGGTTTITVSASGGTAPYTGTGTFVNAKVGNYIFTVVDAHGCSVVTNYTVKAGTTARIGTTATTTADSASVTGQLRNAGLLSGTGQLIISAYPNPTNTDFGLVVQGGSAEMVNITVLSVDGKVVYKTQGTSNRKYTFGNSFMGGMYIIQVIQGNTMQTIKAIKITR